MGGLTKKNLVSVLDGHVKEPDEISMAWDLDRMTTFLTYTCINQT